ncbi:MAG: RluA family pseudouridine synthase [Planctomycetota bacterium]
MSDEFGSETDAPIIDADALTQPGGKLDPDRLREAVESARGGSSSNSMPRVQFTLSRDLSEPRLDKYLTTRIRFLSRSQLQQIIDAGGATVGGKRAKSSTKLRRNDRVRLAIPPPPPTDVVPQQIPIDVLHEDEHLIVLNKRAGIIVHPARSELDGTLINALAWHFEHVSAGGLSPLGKDLARPGVVHRLDRDTTGCIVFAKDEETHWKLGAQFEKRTADKRYLAVTHGRVEPDAHVIDKPIGPHPSKVKGYRERQVVRYDDLGKPSVTICRVHERYRLHDRPVGDQDFCLVELELKTGRTHQIRVHLSDDGWPIVGDDMYGGRPFELFGGEAFERQALHAALLAIEHPMTGEAMAFDAPPPPDMCALIGSLRGSCEPERVFTSGSVPLARFGMEADGACGPRASEDRNIRGPK